VSTAEPLDPSLLDVSLGKRSVQVHGRVALERASDGSFGLHASGLLLRGLGPMLEWGVKLNAAVDASTYEANVLVDESVTYRDVASLVYTLGQSEVPVVHFVVRTAAGLGTLSTSVPRYSDGRPLRHSVCVRQDGTEILDAKAKPTGCGWKTPAFDDAAYRACFQRIEGYALDPPPITDTRIVIGAVTVRGGPSVGFGRMLSTEQGLGQLGLTPTWGTPCD
jgi:hypothetical protein